VQKWKVGAHGIKSLALLVFLGAAHRAMTQDAATPYPNMAPIAQYLMADQGAEIALARSAAPESISHDAGVMVLGRRGFETVIKSGNGFVCIVARSWTSAPDVDFWNPKVRVPMCFNAAAVRSYLPIYIKKTALVLAGRTKVQIKDAVVAAIDNGELPPMESGAMCYMLSKDGYGGEGAPHWPPHLMFYYPLTEAVAWGANLPGSPVEAYSDHAEHRTEFVIVVQRWSDGTEGSRTPAQHLHP
jgi:hypothetical protein